MKVLLDTHVWLWYLTGSPKLPALIRKTLETTHHEIWLSPISIWETLLLGEKGKLTLLPDPITWVRRALDQEPYQEAPLTVEIAFKSREIKLPHQDPADRFLAATALIHDLVLATADRNLLKLKALTTLS